MSDQIISSALQRLGMQVLEETFRSERIEAGMVGSLTDNELSRLGLDTIGSRHQFRKTVSELMKNSTAIQAESTAARRNNVRSERSGLFTGRSRSKKRARNETWTMTFCCLSDRTADHWPSAIEKEILNKAGLGVKKLQIGKNDNESEVIERITAHEGFPQLKDAGGFELLRAAQNSRKLSIINCKWDAKELRQNVNSQTNIYVRPIQRNLSTKPSIPDSEINSLKTACGSCGIVFPVRELREHIEMCQALRRENAGNEGSNSAFHVQIPTPVHFETVEDNEEGYSVSEHQGNQYDIVTTTTPAVMTITGTNTNSAAALRVSEHQENPYNLVTTITPVTFQQSSDYQTPAIFQQSSDYQTPAIFQQSSDHQTPAIFQQSSDHQTPAIFQQSSDHQTPAIFQQSSDHQTPAIFQQSSDHQTPAIFQQSSELQMHVGQMNMTEQSSLSDIQKTTRDCIDFCKTNSITDPVDILRYIQKKIVQGRELDIVSESETLTGETNYISVDRNDVMRCGFQEISHLENLRITLEVEFYEESAVDFGGPRKEFFGSILKEIKEKFFDPVREWSEDYEIIGKILALSTLQNGVLPRVMTGELMEELFSTNPRPFIVDLRRGLDSLGLYQIMVELPTFRQLFTPNTVQLNQRMMKHILKPVFSPEGSNRRPLESLVYSKFLVYLRESGSGRREAVTLRKILKFVTGSTEEPVLGYTLPPEIHFAVGNSFLPTANTCINRLVLPIPGSERELPADGHLFNLYDFAFANDFYGLQ